VPPALLRAEQNLVEKDDPVVVIDVIPRGAALPKPAARRGKPRGKSRRLPLDTRFFHLAARAAAAVGFFQGRGAFANLLLRRVPAAGVVAASGRQPRRGGRARRPRPQDPGPHLPAAHLHPLVTDQEIAKAQQALWSTLRIAAEPGGAAALAALLSHRFEARARQAETSSIRPAPDDQPLSARATAVLSEASVFFAFCCCLVCFFVFSATAGFCLRLLRGFYLVFAGQSRVRGQSGECGGDSGCELAHDALDPAGVAGSQEHCARPWIAQPDRRARHKTGPQLPSRLEISAWKPSRRPQARAKLGCTRRPGKTTNSATASSPGLEKSRTPPVIPRVRGRAGEHRVVAGDVELSPDARNADAGERRHTPEPEVESGNLRPGPLRKSTVSSLSRVVASVTGLCDLATTT